MLISEAIEEAWAALPEAAHDARLTSGNATIGRRPSDRVSRTLLRRILPDHVRRSWPRRVAVTVSETEAAEIGRHIRDAGPALVATVAWMKALEQAWHDAATTSGDRREQLLPIAWRLATEHGEPAVADIARREIALRYPGGVPSADGVRKVLSDPAEHERLSRRLAKVWAARKPPPDGSKTGARERIKALHECLGDEMALDWMSPAADARWAEVVADADIELWHADIVALDLSDGRPPPPPLRRRRTPQRQDRTKDRRLDQAIEERACSLLANRRKNRADLPGDARLLTDEIDRSAASLGLASAQHRAALIVGAEMAMGISASMPKNPGLPRAARSLNGYMARFLHKRSGGPADRTAHAMDDPLPRYVDRLWQRLHHHEASHLAIPDAEDLWSILRWTFYSVLKDATVRRPQAAMAPLREEQLQDAGRPDLSANLDQAVIAAAVVSIVESGRKLSGTDAVWRFAQACLSGDYTVSGEFREQWDSWCAATERTLPEGRPGQEHPDFAMACAYLAQNAPATRSDRP
ncbi:hypothetical protein [Actinomadura violacea]|uniref:Uncharacterized protein n=1 Tax=Actinomadura violacea TaxID=2819934 RepID=A0ABS3S4K0_9ACTN|nr:hypothetical protein [Actinomadura violacea]MBO2463508.1 hypothetical protein [Actinomadura violacea]